MNDLKQEDVMRALECCIKGDIAECGKCPCYRAKGDCVMPQAALALLREKDAEIERLNKELDGQFEKWKILADKTERHYGELYEEAKQVVRADAITEFAERVKEVVYGDCLIEGHTYYVINAASIDQIAKEMKEKHDESKYAKVL